MVKINEEEKKKINKTFVQPKNLPLVNSFYQDKNQPTLQMIQSTKENLLKEKKTRISFQKVILKRVTHSLKQI